MWLSLMPSSGRSKYDRNNGENMRVECKSPNKGMKAHPVQGTDVGKLRGLDRLGFIQSDVVNKISSIRN